MFGSVLGIIGIALALVFTFVPMRVPKHLTQAGVALGMLLAAVALAVSAAQVRNLTEGIRRLARSTVLSNALVPQSPASTIPQSPAAATEPLKTMGDQQVRSRVTTLAHAMCDFEHKFQSDELERKLTRPPVTGNQGEMERQWQAEANSWQRRYGDYENEFRKRFLADALAYREELLRRLNTTPPDEERQMLALHGNLAGASPICDLGVYLESLAIQLAP